MQELKAENILDGLRDRDTKVLDFIYKSFYEQIKVFILRNRGSIEDAKDVYQDALLVIYQKVSRDNLALSCSFQTYLYSVCRLLWLKQLKTNQIEKNAAEETGMYIELGEDILDVFEKNERYKLYQQHFQKLSFSCQKVLELFLAGISLREIANILGFKSEHYAKKRKYQCKEKLINSIKSDPNFKQFKTTNSKLKRS